MNPIPNAPARQRIVDVMIGGQPGAMPQPASPRQQLTPAQMDQLMKLMGTPQPTPFNPILSSAPRG